jgi:hypothetical protein
MEQEPKTLRERAEDLIRLLVPDWRPTTQQVLWSVGIVAALVVAISIVLGYVLEWEWTGLVKDKAYTKRTLWDWLQLLIIPAVLAGVGLWFNRQQREQELQTADRRAQDEALQAYLDQMSDMLIPNNDQPTLYDDRPPDSLRTVARARTLTVLPRLDGDRKAHVVQFLYESGLISSERWVLDLSNANLSGADLSHADLSHADLSHAILSEAKLNGATLSHALLSEATLIGAHLPGATLSEATLSEATLSANLSEANLSEADLSKADLSWANLSGATGWTEEQLYKASSLNFVTMPNGQKYEDWLKNKDRKEDGENDGSL